MKSWVRLAARLRAESRQPEKLLWEKASPARRRGGEGGEEMRSDPGEPG